MLSGPQRGLSSGTAVVAAANDDLRRQFVDFLRGMGFAAIATDGPKAALAAIEEPGRDVKFILAELSREDGTATANALAAHRPAVRALLISSEPEYIHRSQWPQPWLDFLEKPFAWGELRDRVRRLMQTQIPGGETRAAG